MRVFIVVLVLIFSLQSLTKADDISDFEIEEISIMDNLLDHFSKKIIIEAKNHAFIYPKSEKFITIKINQKKGEYDYFQFGIKPEDKNYVIYSLEGNKIYQNNIKECIKQQKIILDELKSFFPNAKMHTDNSPHNYDKSGKSFTYETYYFLKDGGSIGVFCYDWSENMFKENGWADSLMIVIDTQEFSSFLTNEAY